MLLQTLLNPLYQIADMIREREREKQKEYIVMLSIFSLYLFLIFGSTNIRYIINFNKDAVSIKSRKGELFSFYEKKQVFI